jgi:hypothetical protein
MPSTLVPSVEVSLDKKRHICFDVNAHIAFEEATGEQLISVIQGLSAQAREAKEEGATYPKLPPMKTLRAILWAGLLSETLDENGDPTEASLTLKQVGALLNLASLFQLFEQIGQAFAVSMPEATDRPTGAAPSATGSRKRSTGAHSGASRSLISVSKASANSAG